MHNGTEEFGIMKKRILIVGANGFTGRQILETLAQEPDFLVTGTSLHPECCPQGSGYSFVVSDMTDGEALERLFDKVRPEVVINTAALSVTDYAESHRDEADAVNVEAVARLAKACEARKSRFIHLSTDFVFSGDTRRLYTEEDVPAPVNYYGKTKWESEKQVAIWCRNYAVVRVVVVYGNPLPGQHGNIVTLVANRLRNGEAVRVVNDQWRTPVYVDDVVQGVRKLMDYPGNGIFHICGEECLSIADIAFRVADVLGLDRSLIHPVSTEEMQEKTPRPRFSGLSIEKAKRELGYRPRTLEEGIRCMFPE